MTDAADRWTSSHTIWTSIAGRPPLSVQFDLILPFRAGRHLVRKERERGFDARRHWVEQEAGLARIGKCNRPGDKGLIDIALQWRGTRRLRTLYHGGQID